MTVDPINLLGRVATLVGLVAKPELNGRTVVLLAYNKSGDRFAVLLRADPNNASPRVDLSVKRSNLQFASAVFEEQHPHAPVVPGSYHTPAASGTIVDFARCVEDLPPVTSTEPLLFSRACSVRGECGPDDPPTFIPSHVQIKLSSDDEIDFEGVSFTNTGVECAVKCEGGKSITFRKCNFVNVNHCVRVIGAGTKVFFESCRFENCVGSGILVSDHGEATLVHCIFKNLHHGTEVFLDSKITFMYCNISECRMDAACARGKGASMTLKYCTMSGCQDGGVLVSEGGIIDVDSCRITNCGLSGVTVEGARRSTAVVRSTHVSGCVVGVSTQLGKSDTTIKNCKLIQNQMFGMTVELNTVGTVNVIDTTITDNPFGSINNDGGPKCVVTRDGVRVLQDGMMTVGGRADPAVTAMLHQTADELDRELRISGDPSAKIGTAARAAKMAGIGTVKCAACHREEPPKVKFNLCSRCEDCSYCSKDCQVVRLFIMCLTNC